MNTDIRWRLAELRAMAEKALVSVDYEGTDSGRITDVPNERTLRYYTTIGLLDRPAEMRGRTGYYDWRHLLQIVAIKRLQQQGLALVDVQQRLAGRPDSAIAAMAGLPVKPDLATLDAVELTEDEEQDEKETCVAEEEAFWKQGTTRRTVASSSARTMSSVSLGDLMLVWHGQDAEHDDAEALRAAAEPLIREMKKRGLLP